MYRITSRSAATAGYLCFSATTTAVLTDLAALSAHVRNWRAYWRHGANLADADPQAEEIIEAIEQRLRTGRPLAAEHWIAKQEARTAPPWLSASRGR